MLRAFVQELEDLLTSFFEGLGQTIGAALGLAGFAALFWIAWEIVARLI